MVGRSESVHTQMHANSPYFGSSGHSTPKWILYRGKSWKILWNWMSWVRTTSGNLLLLYTWDWPLHWARPDVWWLVSILCRSTVGKASKMRGFCMILPAILGHLMSTLEMVQADSGREHDFNLNPSYRFLFCHANKNHPAFLGSHPMLTHMQMKGQYVFLIAERNGSTEVFAGWAVGPRLSVPIFPWTNSWRYRIFTIFVSRSSMHFCVTGYCSCVSSYPTLFLNGHAFKNVSNTFKNSVFKSWRWCIFKVNRTTHAWHERRHGNFEVRHGQTALDRSGWTIGQLAVAEEFIMMGIERW